LEKYLRTKVERMGHLLVVPPEEAAAAETAREKSGEREEEDDLHAPVSQPNSDDEVDQDAGVAA